MPPISDRAYLKQEMAKRELARKSYRWYLYYVHGRQWRRTKMSDFLADTVQKFVEEDTGNAYDILLIETPPQHGKSITITESFPSWYLGRYPKNRVIEASYNDDTAKKFGRKNLDKVEEFGKALFGMERGSIWNVLEFELSNGWGRMITLLHHRHHPKYSNPEFVETLTDSISRTEKVSNIDFVPFESGSGNRFVAVKEIYSATVTGES